MQMLRRWELKCVVANFNFEIMKKNNELIVKVDLTKAVDAESAYKAFAFTKFNNWLTTTERRIIADQNVKEFFDNLAAQVACDIEILPCGECTFASSEDLPTETKKPNFFKRLWNKLFKKSSR